MDAQWDPNLLLYGEALRSALDGNAIGLAPPHLHMHPGDASAAVAAQGRLPQLDSFGLQPLYPPFINTWQHEPQASEPVAALRQQPQQHACSGTASPGPERCPPDTLDSCAEHSDSPSHLPDKDELEEPLSRRKPGRPIKYPDDALAEHLSHAERSQIKRRIANRESARRVRKRKQHDTDDLSRQVQQAKDRESAMQAHVMAVDKQYTALYAQSQQVHQTCQTSIASLKLLQEENIKLKQEVAFQQGMHTRSHSTDENSSSKRAYRANAAHRPLSKTTSDPPAAATSVSISD